MSSSDDDNDNVARDDGDEEDAYDGFDTDYDDHFDDNGELGYDLGNDDSFDKLLTSIIQPSTDVKDDHLATDRFSHTPASRENVFGDLIESYLERPSFIQPTQSSSSPFYLSLTPTDLTPSPTEILKDRLYATNVALDSTNEQLKQFLQSLGYQDVVRVHVCYKSNRRPGYAFIRCKTEKTAQDIVYDCAHRPSDFAFRNLNIRIVLDETEPQPPKFVQPNQNLDDGSPSAVSFPIQCSTVLPNILHGTLLTSAAMQNIAAIDEQNSNIGCIAQQLLDGTTPYSAAFEIDQGLKKISFVLTRRVCASSSGYTNRSLRFEWHFRDLKGDKISPVLTGEDTSTLSKIDTTLYILIEVKRPPMIIHVEKPDDFSSRQSPRETRLPGNPFIGHANAWLFQLHPSLDLYHQLFKILRRYNLCQQPLSENNIVHYISPKQSVQRFKYVHLLSNDIWIQEHRTSVEHFLKKRWPSYPFERKFEIMKLISKHIVTVHDLIADEVTLDRIFAQCSLKTFTACTDKIIEFASRWISTSDNDDEDWDRKDEETGNPPSSPTSTLSTSVDVTTTVTSKISQMTLKRQPSSTSRLGLLSRLLLRAIDELKQRREIVLNANNIYETKHESKMDKTDSFLIRKIYITPSSFLYEGPYREEKCRVTRQYETEQDCFLRISFRDEDYTKLRNGDIGMTKLYDRIKMILKSGAVLCDRQYSFLAFSSSQLREHSCWMFHSRHPEHTTVNSIRSSMGNFQGIRPVAKYAARLGQSFSTTTKGTEFKSHHFLIKPDEKTSNGQLFTDGIGIITKELARDLSEKMKLQQVPSAFQIRCGGFKGMVCTDVASKIKEQDVLVYFRKSMDKFDTSNLSIDIVRASHNASAYLNRQIILLLSSLGIEDRVFLSLQRSMVEKVIGVTQYATTAEDTLREMNGEGGGNGTHLFMIEYLRRFGLKTEPLVRQMLLCFQAYQLKELRTKSRIFVRDGSCLLGVVDESKTLQYGQVFIQIEQISGKYATSRIIQGPVIVTRNPCFHPGDIRRLEAVDIPILHDLKNVIVFPCQGPQSHPSEMSGGDLDGDTYWISTDPQLIFNHNETPLDYEDQAIKARKQAELISDTEYRIEDVCDFFGEYIQADNLGFIANSHLALADQLEGCAKNEKCIKLARMHSVAVDFAKNGIPAEALTHELRPTAYPHFMEKRDKKAYQSTSILGQLYNELEQVKIDLNSEEHQNIHQFPYSVLLIDGDIDYADEARIIRQEYNRDLKRIMRQYGIRREGELLSGYILKFTSKQYMKQAKAFEIRNDIAHAVRATREKYVRYFWEEFYQSRQENEETPLNRWQTVSRKLTWRNQLELADKHGIYSIEVEKKASAWYRVTYEQLVSRLIQRDRMIRMNGDLFSFAWIAYPVLFRIADVKTEWASITADKNTSKKNKKKRRGRKNRKRH